MILHRDAVDGQVAGALRHDRAAIRRAETSIGAFERLVGVVEYRAADRIAGIGCPSFAVVGGCQH